MNNELQLEQLNLLLNLFFLFLKIFSNFFLFKIFTLKKENFLYFDSSLIRSFFNFLNNNYLNYQHQ